MKYLLALCLAAVLSAGLTFAHGDEQHIMGIVTKITDSTISVGVPPKYGHAEKATVTVNVSTTTKFEKMGRAATIKDIKVGDRVVIHAGKKDGELEAHVVKIGKAK